MTTWENIRSRDEAESEARQGRLESIQLVPSEFGGAAVTENIVFVPSQTRVEKDATSAELLAVFRAGEADRLAVTPEYRADSFVPATLLVSAWRDGEPPSYEKRIRVW